MVCLAFSPALMLMHPATYAFHMPGHFGLSSLLFGWPELNVPAVISWWLYSMVEAQS